MNNRFLFQLLAIIVALAVFSPNSANAQFTISGTVTNPSAMAVPNVDVLLFDSNGNSLGIPATLTDGAGFYIIDNIPFGLPAADYEVRFDPPTLTGLLYTQVPITVSGNTTLDIPLAAGSILSGFVRDTLGVGIPDIDLNFRDENTGDNLTPPGDNTDGTGFYSVVIPPAFYRLTYRPVNGEQLIIVELRDVSVLTNTTIDVTMLGAVIISGNVLGPGSVPVFDADFDAVDVITGIKLVTPGDNTDVNGDFAFLVPPGTYDINVAPLLADKIVPELRQSVIVNSDITLNFLLQAGVLLTGTAKDQFSSPVVGADIDIVDIATGLTLFTPSDKVDASGIYQVIVPVGLYNLDVQPAVLTGLAPVRLTPIQLNIDTTINIVLANGVTVTGTIQSFSGAPVNNVDLDAKDATTNISVPLVGDHTDAFGAFTTVLPVGAFSIEIEPPASRKLAAVLLSGLTFGLDTTLAISLDSALLLSGTVTDSNLAPLANIRLTAKDPLSGDTVFLPGNKTNALGQYSALIVPATYDLLFRPDSSLSLTDSSVLLATPLVNDTTINIILGQLPTPTFTLTGNVVDQVVTPVVNVSVRVLGLGGAPLIAGPITTDGAGFYSFPAINSGTYALSFVPPGGLDLQDSTITSVAVTSNTVQNMVLEPCIGPCSCCLVAGDYDHSGTFNIADVTAGIARIFSSGPAPVCTDEADSNGNNSFNIGDVTYGIARIFSGGAAPVCGTTGS